MFTNRCSEVLFFLILIGLFAPPFASGFISDNASVRKKACPINFEFLNYTIITSQCKGPDYPADRCCAAFKKFACPYAALLNGTTNDCAATMFSYINLYGKYPPGLFANKCREGKKGLRCSASPTPFAIARNPAGHV